MRKIEKLILYSMLFIIAILLSLGTIENGILLTILTFIIIYIFVKKIKIKKFYIFLIVFSLITKILVVVILKVPVLSDYYVLLEASKQTLLGNFNYTKDIYFMHWGYQLFHVFYQALMLKIINNILFLKILNCIYSTVITLIIYLITKKITNEISARVTSLLYAIALYPLYLNTLLGNQQLSLMLILIGIYVLLYKKNSIKNLIIVGLLIGLGNLERPEGIIYILSLIIYLIFDNKKIICIFKKITIILVAYIFITKVPSQIMIQTGINEIGFKNTNPEWKFLLGFNYDTAGRYSDKDTIYLDREKEIIINRLRQYNKIPELFYKKIKIQWLYSDVSIPIEKQEENQLKIKLADIITNYMKFINFTCIILVFYGLYKNKKVNSKVYFFIINVLIYFGAYLLIEVSARYYYNAQIAIIILSSLGISKLIDVIPKRRKYNKKLLNHFIRK